MVLRFYYGAVAFWIFSDLIGSATSAPTSFAVGVKLFSIVLLLRYLAGSTPSTFLRKGQTPAPRLPLGEPV